MTNDEYELIVRKYEKFIFAICYRLTRDYQEAQNLTQETFLSAYRHIDRCDPEKLKPWISRIAVNKAKDFLKSAYIQRVQLTEDYAENPTHSDVSLDERYIADESAEKIRKTIRELKEPYVQVSVLYFIEERSVEEIACILSRPKKTVQTQILRAKHLLRNILKEEYHHE
ncbi:MAG TPA: RNA polymerase sigma factor [Firmicutes bacterium]|nr:RNA polymerase sigma factor [Bacillota bacterium]